MIGRAGTPSPTTQPPLVQTATDTATLSPTNPISSTDTPVPSDTPLPPTNTPLPPSATVIPADTMTPFPAGYTIIDDFSNGLNPAWVVGYGKPIIVNGQLTSTDPTLLSLGDTSWTNYQVEFDVTFKYEDCRLTETSSGLGVRASNSDNMLLYVFSNCYSSWDYLVDGNLTMVPSAQLGGLVKPIHYIIKVDGNKISTYNGPKLLVSFVDTDHPSGNVYLRIQPQTLFDNFKITFLNP